MTGIKSPIEDAYRHALQNRLLSSVYCALNYGVDAKSRKRFRKDWRERGAYDLAQLLLQCARPDWTSYPGTFWMDPWIGELLKASETGTLCYFINQWLDDQPLSADISDDPYVEDHKVKELARLFSALNR
jgi:hypothetical protein